MLKRKCKITYIAHGATIYSDDYRLCSQENYPPLEEKGQEEIKKICEYIRCRGVRSDAIYSSPATRCIQSAQMISKVYKQDFEIVPELNSRNWGDWNGLTLDKIVKKYNIKLSQKAMELIEIETPKELSNVTTQITGSVRELCRAVENECVKYGYEPVVLTDQLCCQAKEAGSFLSSIAKTHANSGKKLAYIAGGETIVNITGHGKGGRNQELALSASVGISGLDNAAVFSFGSDGTDGPTDAAGGYVDSHTYERLKNMGIEVFDVLKNNDSYNALKKTDGLIITGPTGTNVNDVSVLLIG